MTYYVRIKDPKNGVFLFDSILHYGYQRAVSQDGRLTRPGKDENMFESFKVLSFKR